MFYMELSFICCRCGVVAVVVGNGVVAGCWRWWWWRVVGGGWWRLWL